MLAQGPALFMMCYINSGEFERLLNVHSQRDEQRLLFKDSLLKTSGLKSVDTAAAGGSKHTTA